MKNLKEGLKYIGILCLYAFALIWNLPKKIMCKIKKSKPKFTAVKKSGIACVLSAVMIITALPMSSINVNAVGEAPTQDIVSNKETSKTSTEMKSEDFVKQLNGKGQGTVADPYIINTAEELVAFREIVNSSKPDACANLATNIDLSSICSKTKGNWTPIGSKAKQYQGTFNGNDFTVKGLYINAPSKDYQGLFGYAGNKAVITHLKLTDANVSGKSYVGSIVGRIDTTHDYDTPNIKFSYLTAKGTVIGTGDNIGGVAGLSVTAKYCDNHTNVSGVSNVGGISGDGAYIKYCNNYGNISGSSENTGGIAGIVAPSAPGVGSGNKVGEIEYADNQGIINGVKYVGGILGSVDYSSTNVRGVSNNGVVHGTEISVGGISGYFGGKGITAAINNANVTGDKDQVGGVVGWSADGSDHTIIDSYSYGQIKGNGDKVGSIVGYLLSGVIKNCHYLEESAAGSNGSKKGAVGDHPNISQELALKTQEQDFHDGTVVLKLYKNNNNYIGQKITGAKRDPLPVVIRGGKKDPKYVTNFMYRHYYEASENSVTIRANAGDTIGELLPKEFDDCLTFKKNSGETYTRDSIINTIFASAGKECVAISPASFTVTIPASLDFGEQFYTVEADTAHRYATTSANVKIEGHHLEYHKKRVRVVMESSLEMASGDKKIPYTLSYGTDNKKLTANASTEIALETGRDVNKSIPLNASLDRSLLVYDNLKLSNTINFTITYEAFK